jgi:hypothetical protein
MNPLGLLFSFAFSPVLLIPVIGIASAGMALIWGRALFNRNRRRTRLRSAPPATQEAIAAPDPFTHGSASEKRKAFRRGGNPTEIRVTDEKQAAEPVQGWVINRSTGGLGLVIPEPVAEGTVLSIRAANAPTTVPWYQIQVRSCREADDGWEIGSQWVKAPPWSVMLLFG